ncbi:MAG: DUF1697 domain-containing protein [Polyangiaceae bacterium]|nr:DUF1697 domain-containing protein [Polyangiaceae bacterium]
MKRYVALLRGINVGGNNLIRMSDLKSCLEDSGFSGVRTYIQSGNVIFGSTEPARNIAPAVEKALSTAFDYDAKVVVLSQRELATVVDGAPPRFGKSVEHRYNVVFLRSPATPKDVLSIVTPKEGVDEVASGKGVVYVSTLLRAATRSKLARIVGTEVYKSVTIRNWNTTQKLHALMSAADAE